MPSRITPQASSDISSFTQHLAAILPQALCETGGCSPLLQRLTLSSKIHMQLAHASLPWGAELTPLYIVTELGGSQATCPILPALSEELFCGSQSPRLCASFPISFLCLLVLSISWLHPWQWIRSLSLCFLWQFLVIHIALRRLLLPLLGSQVMFFRTLGCFFSPRLFSRSLCNPCSSGHLSASPLAGTPCSTWALRLYLIREPPVFPGESEPCFLPADQGDPFYHLRNKLMLYHHFPDREVRERAGPCSVLAIVPLGGVMDVPSPDTAGIYLLAGFPGPLHASSCTFSATSKISQQQSLAQ